MRAPPRMAGTSAKLKRKPQTVTSSAPAVTQSHTSTPMRTATTVVRR